MSARSSISVGSLFRITSAAPFSFAITGNPAAGNTTRDEPMEMNRSHSRAAARARNMGSSGIA